MAIFNSNYQIVNLPTGTYTLNELGNGVSASTVHQLFCVADAVATVTALGGGSFQWTASTGDILDITLGKCVVTSGELAGFKAPSNSQQQKRVFFS